MSTVNGGQLVVRALEAEGVTHVFSISGGHIAPIYDALNDSKIELVTTRHEQAAAMMAGAWARATGQPGVVVVTAGPGFTNALTGIADSYMAGAPLVCIGGSTGVSMADRLDLQDLNQLDMIKPVTKWARRLTVSNRILEMTHEAFKQARGGAPGPTYLEIPVDTLGRKVKEASVVPSRPHERPRPGLAPDEIERAIEIIRDAKRPVVVAGSGVYYADGSQALVDFVEASGVPAYPLLLGKGCIPDDHPLCFGNALPLKPGSALKALSSSDAVILVGTRISMFFMHGKIFNPNAKIIHVNIDPVELGRNRVPDLPLVADAGRALAQLADAAKDGLDPKAFDPWRADLQKAHDQAMKLFAPQLANDEEPIHPLRLCKELEDLLDDDDMLIYDGGDTQIWMGMVHRDRRPGRVLESGLFGCLGVGIPFGMAAALAHPDRRVVVFIGDGSLGFNFMELQTATSLGLNLTVVVNNDQAWGMVKHAQMISYGKDRCCGVELGDVPYDKTFEGLGGWAARVDKVADVRPTLEDALGRDGVKLVNVLVKPGVISPAGAALAGLG